MQIGVMEVILYAPWVHSLKEKRMVVKSLTSKIRNKFNVSVCEADMHDMHQTIVIAMACVFSDGLNFDSVWDSIINFIEVNTEAEITKIIREIR